MHENRSLMTNRLRSHEDDPRAVAVFSEASTRQDVVPREHTLVSGSWIARYTCKTPVRKGRPSSYRVATSSAVSSADRVCTGSRIASTHSRAAP